MAEEEEEKLRIFKMLRDNPAAFAEYVLDFKPFPYQEKFLLDPSKRIVACAGRQVGKSLMASAKALWFALTHDGTTTLIISATLRQSSLLFEKILSMIDSAPLVSKAVTVCTRTRVRFSNNSWIIALPCGTIGATLRGHTAHQMILDEAAFIPERVIAEVALPMLATTDGSVIMLSTPYDRDHIFHKAFTSPTWSKYHFPSSVNPLITKEFLEEQRELSGEQVFDQEYMAEFVDDTKAYFPMPLLRSNIHFCTKIPCDYCETLSASDGKLSDSRRFYAGYDPGGKVDPSAFVIVEKMKDQTLRVVLTKTYLADPKRDEGNLYTNFTVGIAEYHKRYGFGKLMVDSTGLGSPIVEQCRALKMPTEGLQLTVNSKEQILSNLRILLENRRLVLPNDMMLLANLNCIEAERAAGGHFVFSHSRGSHDDLAFALALACHAASKSSSIIMMTRDIKEANWRDAFSGLS